MPAALIVIVAVLLIAVALAIVGVLMSIKGTGSVPKTGGWLTIISGLVAVCFAVAVVVMLIGASMDDVPGLW
jgi:NADH:ubiquinone oxidoreductase subunit 6 (subunit J)